MLRCLSSLTLSSDGDNLDSTREVRDILEVCFQTLKKSSNNVNQQQQYNNYSLDIIVEYLHSEWLYTIADLQLGNG